MINLAQTRWNAELERYSFETSEPVVQIVALAELQVAEAVRTAILNYSTEVVISWVACPTMRECLAACRVLTRRTGMPCSSEYDTNLGRVKFTFQLPQD